MILRINKFLVQNTYNGDWESDSDINFEKIKIDQPLFLQEIFY